VANEAGRFYSVRELDRNYIASQADQKFCRRGWKEPRSSYITTFRDDVGLSPWGELDDEHRSTTFLEYEIENPENMGMHEIITES
jgi:hypothetical protein